MINNKPRPQKLRDLVLPTAAAVCQMGAKRSSRTGNPWLRLHITNPPPENRSFTKPGYEGDLPNVWKFIGLDKRPAGGIRTEAASRYSFLSVALIVTVVVGEP